MGAGCAWNEDKSVPFPIILHAADFRDYRVDLSRNPDWARPAIGIRSEPVANASRAEYDRDLVVGPRPNRRPDEHDYRHKQHVFTSTGLYQSTTQCVMWNHRFFESGDADPGKAEPMHRLAR